MRANPWTTAILLTIALFVLTVLTAAGIGYVARPVEGAPRSGPNWSQVGPDVYAVDFPFRGGDRIVTCYSRGATAASLSCVVDP